MTTEAFLSRRDDRKRFSPPGHFLTDSWPLVTAGEGAKNVAVHVSEMQPGGAAYKHVHQQSEQVYVALSGKARMVAGSKTFDVEPGDAVYIPAGIEHEAQVVGNAPFKSLVILAPPA